MASSGIADFYRGDTKNYLLEIKDENDDPIDITGATVWFTMKVADGDDSAAVLQVEISSHTSPSLGRTTVTLPAAKTTMLEVRTYFYDFQLVTSSGSVYTFLAGTVNVLMDVTRSII